MLKSELNYVYRAVCVLASVSQAFSPKNAERAPWQKWPHQTGPCNTMQSSFREVPSLPVDYRFLRAWPSTFTPRVPGSTLLFQAANGRSRSQKARKLRTRKAGKPGSREAKGTPLCHSTLSLPLMRKSYNPHA